MQEQPLFLFYLNSLDGVVIFDVLGYGEIFVLPLYFSACDVVTVHTRTLFHYSYNIIKVYFCKGVQ